jgi:hypothetical protein
MANTIFSTFMSMSRNNNVWAQCLEPFEPSNNPTPVNIMNQNLLQSYTSSSRSDTSSRPASPFSDSDIEVDSANNQDIPSGQYDSDTEMGFQVPRLPITEEFQYPHHASPDYLVLDTNFDINAVKNKKIPYPSEIEPRKVWTEAERIRASHAEVPQSREDFALMVSNI